MAKPESIKGRVLCVTSNFPRWEGDSTTPFVKNLADDLSERGWKIDVLAPHAPGALKKETSNKLDITRFQYFWPASLQTVCYQGGALINLRKSVWNKIKLPFLVMAEFVAMARLLFKHDYDLLHAHWILPQGFNAVLLGKLFRIPIIVTAHGGDVFGLKGKHLSAFKHWVLQHSSAVTANSGFTANKIKNISPELKGLHIIPMGISVHPLSTEQKRRAILIRQHYKQGDDPLLVFAGRLVEEKGIADFLNAVEIIKNDLPGTRVLILGEGQDRKHFEALATKLDITNMVIFKGWVDGKEIAAHLAAADFFVGPSKTAKDGWIEAQGLSFLEAMSTGTPVIATASGGIVETVRNNETGFLVSETNPKQIVEIIKKFHGQDMLLDKVRKNAREMVLKRFSRKVSADNFSQLFDSLVAEQNSSR